MPSATLVTPVVALASLTAVAVIEVAPVDVTGARMDARVAAEAVISASGIDALTWNSPMAIFVVVALAVFVAFAVTATEPDARIGLEMTAVVAPSSVAVAVRTPAEKRPPPAAVASAVARLPLPPAVSILAETVTAPPLMTNGPSR